MGGPVWPLKAIGNDRANRAVALKEVVEHRKDFAAVADLAHRQRRSIGAQTLIQRPKQRTGHIERAATGFADFQVGKELVQESGHLVCSVRRRDKRQPSLEQQERSDEH
jgi:hypothetical protein